MTVKMIKGRAQKPRVAETRSLKRLKRLKSRRNLRKESQDLDTDPEKGVLPKSEKRRNRVVEELARKWRLSLSLSPETTPSLTNRAPLRLPSLRLGARM
jgi:hypothetical protein